MKHTLYSNYYGWIDEEDLKMSILDSERVDNEEEITDDMLWDEMHFLEEIYWDDFSHELKNFFDKGSAWLLVGNIRRWNGNCKGGYIFNTFEEFCKCLEDCDYIEITDNKGHLEIKCSHHDGTNHYEIKRVSDFGYEWYDNHAWDMCEEELHTKMWNNNFMTSLPHFARDVYGCKE
jgi:hypothetical protein